MEESDEGGFSLTGLFFEGPTADKVSGDQTLKGWLHAQAPCIAEIPPTQDLQDELKSAKSTAMLMKPKKFIPPFKKTNAENQSPVTYASQCEINLSTDTGNTSSGKVSLAFPLCSHVDDEVQNTDSQQISLQSKLQATKNDNTSKFKKSLFKKYNYANEDGLVATENTISSVPGNHIETDGNLLQINHDVNYSQTSELYIQKDGGGSLQFGATDKETFPFPTSLTVLSTKDEPKYGILRPVTEIRILFFHPNAMGILASKQFRNIFKEFPYFNYIQSKAIDDLLYTDKNFVICAPTGSGKTVIFELAITRLLMEAPMPWMNIKIVYMAPIKALCSQRFDEWKEKFGPIGLTCKELTGDTQMDDLFEIQHAQIIVTTPEKWDSMTRKWRDNSLVQLVRLFLIDEVHTLKDESRGATLEVVVSRMKTMQSSLSRITRESDIPVPMRFVSVSATIPNAEDIAEWLSDGKHPAVCMKMDETHRPVKLRKVVLGFPCSSNQTEFKFDLTLNYKVAGVIQTYSEQKPTLVFCATRKGVQQGATVLAKDAKFIMNIEHKQRLQKSANAIKDAKLRDLMLYGIGYHHAGVDVSDRKIIEAAFREGDLPVLFTTSTLAMGVNLPAHLVVIKSTMHYASGMFQEYNETDILQMIGRAGRPQFDTTATAVIMTRLNTREKYVHMLDGADTIESSLHRHLVEHLNAEITLHTVTDVNIALEWIRSTFLYIRALKNPTHYGFPEGLDKMGIEAKLQELCLKNLNDLSSVGLIKMDEEVNFKPTETGKLMASYYIAFDTAKLFHTISGTETLSEMVAVLSACKEFADVQLRTNEKKILNTLNKDKNRVTIRYPMEGKIKSREMKVNCLIQAQLGCIPVQDFSLTQDMAKIFRHGVRVTKCLSEFLALQEGKFVAFLNATILGKCFRCKLWENSSYVSKQLEKIGVTLSNAMVNTGLTTFKKIEDTNGRELELIVNRHPPFGNQIKESVMYLPKYELGFEQLARYGPTMAEIVITVLLKNFEQLQRKRTAPDSHHVTLIIGDADNKVIFKQKINDSALLKTGTWTRKIEIKRASKSEDLSVNLISSEYVGLDIQQNFNVFYLGPRFATEMEDQHKSRSALSDASSQNARTGSCGTQAAIKNRMRECNHHCRNKDACGHDCCKTGVTQKADIKTNSNFASYLTDLRIRNSVSSAPPVKRLKMQMESENNIMNLQTFVYTPKASITASLWSPEVKTLAQSSLHPDNANNVNSINSYPHPPQDGARTTINSTMSNLTDADKRSSWSEKNLSVTFDLGNEVWDDFDDDNLLDASNVSNEATAIALPLDVVGLPDATSKALGFAASLHPTIGDIGNSGASGALWPLGHWKMVLKLKEVNDHTSDLDINTFSSGRYSKHGDPKTSSLDLSRTVTLIEMRDNREPSHPRKARGNLPLKIVPNHQITKILNLYG
ncbi:probable ATP-dependent DNA helicase HFM1 [Spea bombifrons]|uniref:probable ATP-dependent DNA helicase HFM1 n=1 Tax=Spea bombifrons TaxID=233779 RepID=UPI00234A59C3|nr:probable ATP-dependent DNA helicase HFM1 [Spea bombifrons]